MLCRKFCQLNLYWTQYYSFKSLLSSCQPVAKHMLETNNKTSCNQSWGRKSYVSCRSKCQRQRNECCAYKGMWFKGESHTTHSCTDGKHNSETSGCNRDWFCHFSMGSIWRHQTGSEIWSTNVYHKLQTSLGLKPILESPTLSNLR